MQYSIVNFSEVKKTLDLRMDAEYWHPSFIKNSKLFSSKYIIQNFISDGLSNIKSSPINRDFEYLEISKIPLGSLSYDTTQIRQGAEPDRAHYILQKKDVVVSTVRPNRNAVALIGKDGIIGSSGLCVLRARNIEPEYLFVFCKTKYFVKCLMRANKATMYPAVSYKDILKMSFLFPASDFRKRIKHNIQKALSYIEESGKAFKQAQDILLSELGLKDWKPKHYLSFTRQYSDVEQAGRMDAEYFQPKYEQIIHKIKTYKGGWDTLGNLVDIKDNHFKPKPTFLYKYIELSHVSENGKIINCISEKGKNLPSRARRLISRRDVIVSSIEGSLSKVAVIDSNYDQCICSNGFYVINSNNINSETLLVFLKSITGQFQLKRSCSGYILTAISKNSFRNIIFPKIGIDIQKKIQIIIMNSLKLYKKSTKLMELSKQVVEKAIEKDEKQALHHLKNKLSQLSQK